MEVHGYHFTMLQKPKSALTSHFNGQKRKKEAHEHHQALSYAEVHVLVDWLKEMGHQGVPLHASAVALHTSAILGHLIGEKWVHWFCLWHPDIKMKWTSNPEKYSVQALNPVAVQGFYDILKKVSEMGEAGLLS